MSYLRAMERIPDYINALEEAVKVLRPLEFVEESHIGYRCQTCWRMINQGHGEKCALGNALKRLEEVKSGRP